MRSTKAVLATAGVALLIGAGPAQAAEKRPAVAIIDHSDTCESATDAGAQETLLPAILSLVITQAVTEGIKGLGSAMTKAGEKKEIHILGSRPTYFYKADFSSEPKLRRFANCFRVAAGYTGGDGELLDGDDPNGPDVGDAAWLSQSAGFSRAPNVYVEARFILSDDRSALRLVPVSAYVGKPLQGRQGKDLVVTFSVTSPSASGDGDVLASRSFKFNRSWRGRVPKTELEALPSDWIPLPALPESSKALFDAAVQRRKDVEELKKARRALASTQAAAAALGSASTGAGAATGPQPTLAEIDARIHALEAAAAKDPANLAHLMPVTFRVDVHETADGNKLMAAIGGFLTGNADKIAEPIVAAVDPAKRRASALATAASAQELRIKAIEATEASRTADADPATTPAARRVKQLQAAGACRDLRAADLDDVACLGF